MDKRGKYKIGFVEADSNSIIQYQGLNGKIIAMSPGVRFIWGYYLKRDMSVQKRKFGSIIVRNQFNQDLIFDFNISYKIAGGLSFDDADSHLYQKNVANFAYDEKILSKDNCLIKDENNYKNDLHFTYIAKNLDPAHSDKFWKYHHPIIEYIKYEDEINDEINGVQGAHILKNSIQSAAKDIFTDCDYFDLVNMVSSNAKMKHLYVKTKKSFLEKGLQTTELMLDNIRMIDTNDLTEYKSDVVFIISDETFVTKNNSDDEFQYEKIDFEKYDYNSDDEIDDEELEFEVINNQEFDVAVNSKKKEKILTFGKNNYRKKTNDSKVYDNYYDLLVNGPEEPLSNDEIIDELIHENDILINKNNELVKEKQLMQEEIDITKYENENKKEAEMEVIYLDSVNKDLNDKVVNQDQRIYELETENYELTNTTSEIMDENDELFTDNRRLVVNNRQLSEELAIAKAENENKKEAEMEVIYLDSVNKELSEKVANQDQRIYELEIENYELNNNSDDAIKDEIIDNLKTENDELSEELAAYASKTAALLIEKDIMENREIVLNNNNIRLRKKYNDSKLKNASLKRKIDSLEDTVESLKDDSLTSVLKEKNAKLLKNSLDNKEKYESANAENIVLRSRVNNYKSKAVNAEMDNMYLSDQNDDLTSKTKEQDQRIYDLEVENYELEQEYNRLLDENTLLRNQVASNDVHDANIIQIKNEIINNLKAENARINENYVLESQEKTRLLIAKDDAENEVISIINQNNKLEDDQAALNDTVNNLKDNNLKANNKIKRLENKNDKSQKTIEELKAKIKELEEKNDSLKANTPEDELKEKISNLEAEKEKLIKKINDYKTKNKDLKANNNKLEEDNMSLSANNKELEEKNKTIVIENNNLKNQLNDATKLIDEKDNTINSITEENNSLKEQLAAMKEELENIKKQSIKKESTISNLKVYKLDIDKVVLVKSNGQDMNYRIAIKGDLKCDKDADIDTIIYKMMKEAVLQKVLIKK